MSMTITNLEPGNRIQLPAEWLAALGSPAAVRLERTAEGILVRPCSQQGPAPQASWDEFFATKLVIGSASTAGVEGDDEDLEVSKDDYLL